MSIESYFEERLQLFFKTPVGKTLSEQDKIALTNRKLRRIDISDISTPYIDCIKKHHGRNSPLLSISNINDYYSEYVDHQSIFVQALQLNKSGNLSSTIKFLKKDIKKNKKLMSEHELRMLCAQHNINRQTCFQEESYYFIFDIPLNMKERSHIESFFQDPTTPQFLHGNPYNSDKFALWLEVNKDHHILKNIERNIQIIHYFFKKLNIEDHHIYSLFRKFILKNKGDIIHLSQDLPWLEETYLLSTVIDDDILTIRDLFFDKSSYGWIPNQDSFEYYRSYFLEEALQKTKIELNISDADFDLLF